MCLNSSVNLISEVVNRFINQNRMFTAFEVSLAVQEYARDQGQPVERHSEMRAAVHEELQQYLDSGNWERTLRDVGAPDRAFLYYPVGADPSQYVPLTRRDKPGTTVLVTAAGGDGTISTPVGSVTSTQNSITALPPVSPDGSGPNKGRRTDHRGTLAVSAVLLGEVGFKFNDLVKVYARTDDQNRNVLAVVKAVPAGFDELAEYTVDHSGNVRITNSVLVSGSICTDPNDTYEFEKVGEEVLVRKA